MMLYVCEQGTMLRKSGQRIIAARDRKVLQDIPVERLDRVWLYGNVQLTSQAAALLMEAGVDVVFLSYRGKMRGHLRGMISKNIFLRLAQYKKWQNREFKRDFACSVVKRKLGNMRILLLRFQRNHPEVDFSETIDMLADKTYQLDKKEYTANQLMGVEGSCSRLYFQAFAKMLRQDLGFTGRNRRPPKDPVNALLSLLYTMLSSEIACVLEASSFDPYLGFYHGLRYGRVSLALDIVEEFRQPLVDNYIITLVNKRVFQEGDFYRLKDGGMYLNKESFKKFFEHYEKKMHHSKEENSVNWRNIIIKQVKQLEAHVMDDIPYFGYQEK